MKRMELASLRGTDFQMQTRLLQRGYWLAFRNCADPLSRAWQHRRSGKQIRLWRDMKLRFVVYPLLMACTTLMPGLVFAADTADSPGITALV